MIRIALAEDHAIVRWGLREALTTKADDIQVVGEAGTAAQTLEVIESTKPDLLLLDLTFPDGSGFDVLSQLRTKASAPLVIVLTWHTEPSYAARALAAGAHGFVNKNVEPDQLFAAIRAVCRGEQAFPAGTEELVASSTEGNPAAVLTAREQQVMEMLARGLTNREIAEQLQISIKTVDTHRGHVLKKLGLRNNTELARFAVKHGFVAL